MNPGFFFKLSFFSVLAGIAFAQKESGYQLVYQPHSKIMVYRTYIQGSINRGESEEPVHIQFLLNRQLKIDEAGRYIYWQWGEKYQGSPFDFTELDLPLPGQRVEKVMDKLGRVEKVSRYLPGHRYYLNLLVFPEHPLSLPASWRYDYQLKFELADSSVPASCQIIYRLEKILNYKDYNCAKIQVQGLCQGGKPEDKMFSYQFQGRSYFDIENGQEVDNQINFSWLKLDKPNNLTESAKIELYTIMEK